MTTAGDGAGCDGATRAYLARAVLRQLGVVTAMTVLYFVLPLDDRRAGQALVLLAIGLLGFGVLAVWQVRAVLRSPYPLVRSLDALAVTVPLYLLLFASAYVLMSARTPAAFTEELDRVDALYFTMTVFATVGFGDIAPVTQTARAVVLGQMVANLAILGLLLRLLTGAVRINRGHRAGRGRQP